METPAGSLGGSAASEAWESPSGAASPPPPGPREPSQPKGSSPGPADGEMLEGFRTSSPRCLCAGDKAAFLARVAKVLKWTVLVSSP